MQFYTGMTNRKLKTRTKKHVAEIMRTTTWAQIMQLRIFRNRFLKKEEFIRQGFIYYLLSGNHILRSEIFGMRQCLSSYLKVGKRCYAGLLIMLENNSYSQILNFILFYICTDFHFHEISWYCLLSSCKKLFFKNVSVKKDFENFVMCVMKHTLN